MSKHSRFILHFSSFILALVLAASLAALDVPPAPTQWVTDSAGLLGGTEVDLLNRKLADFEQSSGAQFIIYTFESLGDESLEDFTIRCVERWKVGQKKYDNGLVLFVFEQEQKTRIEVGYGLEGTITDAFSSRVLREMIAPRFQRRDYGGGLNAAADAIIKKIQTGEEPVPPLQRRDAAPAGQGDSSNDNPMLIIFILFVVFFFIVPMISGGRRRRRGGSSGCGGCFWPMFFFPGGGGGITFGGGGFGGGGGWGGGGGGFSGGGGGFGGGGASGGW